MAYIEKPINKKKLLSIVIPVFNSEKTISRIYERVTKSFKNSNYEVEIIMVEDHSKDKSWDKVRELSRKDERVRGIKLSRNFGQHAATLCGIKSSKGDYVATIDDDLEQPPEQLVEMLSEIEKGYDLVYGVFINKTHSMWRKISSELIKFILNFLTPGFKNYSSMRMISRNIANGLSNFDSPYPIVDGYLNWLTNNYSFIEIKHGPRYKGKSNYSLKSLLYLSRNFIIGFSEGPIQIVSILGIFLSFIGFLYALIIIIQKLIGITIISGYASTMTSILIIGGLQLFLIGILGEYIARISFSSSKKPLFVIAIDTKSHLLE